MANLSGTTAVLVPAAGPVVYILLTSTSDRPVIKVDYAALINELDMIIADNLLLKYLPGWYSVGYEGYYHTTCRLDGLVTLIGILRHQQDLGVLPESLDELMQAGYLETLPTDPYGKETLQYRIEGDDFLLYSFGSDFDDDGGRQKESYRDHDW